MAGASGGGLAAILAKCDVSASDVMSSAYDMAIEHAIWDRPMRMAGSWGGHIEGWLDALLPHDAAQRCAGQVRGVHACLTCGRMKLRMRMRRG
jgi:hypothetical protein